MKTIISLAALLLISLQLWAQGYQLGQKVANFTLKDAGGRNVSLADFNKEKTIVVVFTNSLCPYAKLYENRLMSLSRSYSPRGVKFLLINPAIGRQENGETMESFAEKARQLGDLPFLADEGQKITGQFGATKTPEVFVLHNVNGEFFLKYKGAIDDNPQVENYVNDYYLKNALEALLNNQSIRTVDKRATGCLIK